MTLNDNIHCIRAGTGLRLKRVKRMLYALNHQVYDKPVYMSDVSLRNKSWKPECVLSFNMGWRILVFYPWTGLRDKFTNIRQPTLKFKTHSGFHELVQF